jgi:short-subunit dehydrogenase
MVHSKQYGTPSSSPDADNASPTYTLITGGSHGIGRAMAEECARRGRHLLLVALDNADLPATTDELRQRYGVRVDHLGLDLTEEGAPTRVFDWCAERGYVVDALINNAGFGRSGIFEEGRLDEYLAMVRLNNQVLVEMTYRFLPALRRLPAAHHLNKSSMEATLPIPYKSVYTGTKHFVYAFSLALREELKDTSVRASVLCPGPTVTNEDGLRRIQSQGRRARLLVMMPDQVAAAAIPGMLRGRAVIIPGRLPKAIVRVMKFLPTATKMAVVERIFRSYKYAAGA